MVELPETDAGCIAWRVGLMAPLRFGSPVVTPQGVAPGPFLGFDWAGVLAIASTIGLKGEIGLDYLASIEAGVIEALTGASRQEPEDGDEGGGDAGI